MVKRINIPKLCTYAALILVSYQFLYPLLRMITTSLMSTEDIINPVVNWLPRTWSFGNLRMAWAVMDPRTTMLNSIWFSALLSAGQTFVAATAGYAFARYEFAFKRFWFMMVITSFILPTPVMLIPRTMMAVSVNDLWGIQMIGTPYPQILLAVFGQGVFSAILILIFYNFTKMIPQALDEAAAIDGASQFKIFYHVILKLSVSTLLVVFLLSFVWNWNETYITGIFLGNSIELMPVRLGRFAALFPGAAAAAGVPGGGMGDLADISPDVQRINEAFRMAGTMISMLPLFALYLLVQKQFIKGIENTGITGI